MNGGNGVTNLRDFTAELMAFSDASILEAEWVLRDAAAVAAEAVVIGNEYGPGVPVDLGFARSSFRVGINNIEDGPTVPPARPKGHKPGDGPIIAEEFDASPIQGAKLGDVIYVTTGVEYTEYLEDGGMARRFGPNAGADTVFIAPVEARWPQIVEDAARRHGFGEEASYGD